MNEHWKVIDAGDTDRPIISPSDMLERAFEYFRWMDGNPIENKDTLKSGKTQGASVMREKRRPYLVKGLCLHLGISERYLMEMGQMYGHESPWYKVADKLLNIIYVQNLEGAIVEDFNPTIISRLLNLDKPGEEESKPVRVEVIDTRQKELPTSENEILQNLNFDLVQTFRNKVAEGDST